jgi:hypothetical protein
MPEYYENVYKSFRNVPSICGTLLSDINTYDIVNAESVIFTESAAKIFVEENKEEDTKPEPVAKKAKSKDSEDNKEAAEA